MRISTAYFAGVGTVVVRSPPVLAVAIWPQTLPTRLRQGCPNWNAGCRPSRYPSRRHRRAGGAVAMTRRRLPRRHRNNRNRRRSAAGPPPQTGRQRHRPIMRASKRSPPHQPQQPVQAPPQSAKPVEQTTERTATPQDAFARARDADVKRADAEQRRAERRQRWADRRRVQQPREQELEAVEARVREVTEPRRIRIREEGGPGGCSPNRREPICRGSGCSIRTDQFVSWRPAPGV